MLIVEIKFRYNYIAKKNNQFAVKNVKTKYSAIKCNGKCKISSFDPM
jgi:replication initiation and membrane attachment protein DnaB